MAAGSKKKGSPADGFEAPATDAQEGTQGPPILDVKGAMRLTRLGRTFLYKAMKDQGLPYHACGERCRRFLADELIEWVRSRPAR